MRLLSYLLAVLVIPAALFAAGHAGDADAAARSKVTEIRVTERDFRISAPKAATHGDFLLSVTNKGPDDHELIVARDSSTRLPLRTDGMTINEEALQSIVEPALEPGPPGSVRELRLHLRAGRYVLFCNMAGHFMGGMHTELVVR